MPLPKIQSPTYKTKLPVSNKNVSYRPFLVKEEKILLLAMESDDVAEYFTALEQIANNCLLTDNIDVETLSMTDIQFLFAQIRGKSIGEMLDIELKCSECEKTTPVEIDITKPKVTKDRKHSTKVELKDAEIVIEFQYPSINLLKSLSERDVDINKVEGIMSLVKECMVAVHDAETVYRMDETAPEDIDEFIESLSNSQFGKIKDFFTSIPTMKYHVEFTCSHCETKNEYDFEGLENFFG
jgi:hypothetical protein